LFESGCSEFAKDLRTRNSSNGLEPQKNVKAEDGAVDAGTEYEAVMKYEPMDNVVDSTVQPQYESMHEGMKPKYEEDRDDGSDDMNDIIIQAPPPKQQRKVNFLTKLKSCSLSDIEKRLTRNLNNFHCRFRSLKGN
jgi:hypothetical protein